MNNDLETMTVNPISDDLSRGELITPAEWVFEEHISFRTDSGYYAKNILLRAISSIERAFTGCTGNRDLTDQTLSKLPNFRPENKLVITVKVVSE